MPDVLLRMKALTDRRPVRWWLGLLVLGLSFSTAVPVLALPGYEWSALVSLVLCLLAWPVGVAAGRFEAQTRLKAVPSVLGAWAVLLGALVVPFLVAVGVCVLTTPCDPFAAVEWVLVLPVVSALVVAAVGVWVGAMTTRWWSAALLYGAILLGSALLTSWPLVLGPQVFAFNHLGGYLPGPLYDEELSLERPVLWFRLSSMLIAFTLVALTNFMWHRRGLLQVLLCAGGVVALEWNAPGLGFRMSDAALDAQLGGLKKVGPIELHYAESIAPAEVELFLADVTFRYQQVAQFVGGEPEAVRVFLYKSAAQKKALVGAGDTQFAKPWRREVHVNALGWPHPVIKHEMVHAMAAGWGAGPFGVTSRWLGLYPNAGIIEGLAVAADNPVDDLTLHEWAAALKTQKWLPDVEVLMGPSGFYSAPASRAYSTAGSFIRWLVETRGSDKVRTLYGSGDFEGVYGVPLHQLASEYSAFLDTVPLEEMAVNQAFERFKRGSVFETACAREVANLELTEDQLRASAPRLALAANQRCRQIQPGDPGLALRQARLLRALDRTEEAVSVLNVLLADPKTASTSRAEALLEVADISLEQGNETLAADALEKARTVNASPALTRTALVRLAGLQMSGASKAAVNFYFAGKRDEVAMVRLRESLIEDPANAVLAYLLGRKLQQSGDGEKALPWLLEALHSTELNPLIRKEAARLATQSAVQSKQCPLIPDMGEFGATAEKRARDWRERCEWQATH